MTEAEQICKIMVACNEKLFDALERNTEKLQDLLERVECIDNSLDDIKDARGVNEQSEADYRENVLGWLLKLHTQGSRF